MRRTTRRGPAGWVGLLLVALAGCRTTDPDLHCLLPDVPRELEKMSHPRYVIEPPDILLVDALRVFPKPPYRLNPYDALNIQASVSLPGEPVNAVYPVEPDGTVNLGPTYGSVTVVDLTVEEAQAEIQKRLRKSVKETTVSVTLAQARGVQQIRGEHLVRPDGTISLGLYGSVYVSGMTLAEAKSAIEAHLSEFLLRP